jgi:hypothetical protein
MKKIELTLATALNMIALRDNASAPITENDIINLVANVKGNTRASFCSVTDVPLAAAHKKAGVSIIKVSAVGAALYNGMNKDTNPYLNKMAKAGHDDHELKQAWHEHYNGVFSLVQKRSNPTEKYLYALPDSGSSIYVMDGVQVDRQTVASYQTASEAKSTLGASDEPVACRVYKLANILSIRAVGDELVVW